MAILGITKTQKPKPDRNPKCTSQRKKGFFFGGDEKIYRSSDRRGRLEGRSVDHSQMFVLFVWLYKSNFSNFRGTYLRTRDRSRGDGILVVLYNSEDCFVTVRSTVGVLFEIDPL